MLENQPLHRLRNIYRQDFIDYEAYLGVSASISKNTTISSRSSIVKNYESLLALQDSLKTSLRTRIDASELMGLAANQIGIPAHAVYFEYLFKGEIKQLLLTDPEIESASEKDHRLFLKLIKCPNSPTPYHIGIFNQSIIVKSSNNKDFNISINDTNIDPNGNITANLQRVVWADKGFVPGDNTEVPMNYFNVCRTLEKSDKLKDIFNCWIKKEEIELILDTFKVVDSMGMHRIGTRALHKNFLELLTTNLDRNWIKVPAENMFKENNNFSLN